MRTRRLGWAAHSIPWVLAAMLAAPVPAAAQCSMMGGGGHDHSAASGRDARKPPASRKKLQQSIDRLLSDEQGRALLSSALLDDRAFMESLFQRIAAIPEFKSMAMRRLAPGAAMDSLGAARDPAPAVTAEVYACPMHPEVTSGRPGACPKCGMALVRTGRDHEH